MNMDVDQIKTIIDAMIAELKESTYKNVQLAVGSKDGTDTVMGIKDDIIETSAAGILCKGKAIEVKKRKKTTNFKTMVFLPWSEVTKATGTELTETSME